jgi:hypothetical protein
VSSVEVTSPPQTMVASGRCTSAPTPVASAMGMKPSAATSAAMSTSRARSRVAATAASAGERPSSSSCRRRVMRTTPFSTATPESAMKLTADEIETGMPRAPSAMMPPTVANGTSRKPDRYAP